MAGVNKVIIIGNLGQDPEVRYTQAGGAITSISVATSEVWKDKNTGQQNERAEWHKIVLFNRLGEVAGEYLKKGSKVYIEGKLQTRKWQDQQGNDRYSTEIVADQMQMLDGRAGENSQQGGQNQQGGHQGRQASNQPQSNNGAQQGNSSDFDDSDGIPF